MMNVVETRFKKRKGVDNTTTFEAVRKMISLGKGYEILTDGPRKAYYDYETYHETEDDEARDEELKAAFDHVRSLFGRVKIYSFCASGWKRSHKSYVHSFHFIVKRAFEDTQDIPRATLPGFDQCIYGKNCLFRLPYASKEGEDRRLIRVSRRGKRFSLKQIEERGESLRDWSIMFTEGIKIVPRSPRAAVEKKRIEKIKIVTARRIGKIDNATLRELVELIEDSRAVEAMEWDEWIILIWSLKTLGADLNTVLALSQQSPKYDEAYTIKKYDEGASRVSPGALVKLLKKHGVSVPFIETSNASRYIEEDSDTESGGEVEDKSNKPHFIDSDADTDTEEEGEGEAKEEDGDLVIDMDEKKEEEPKRLTLAEKMCLSIEEPLAAAEEIKHEGIEVIKYEKQYMDDYPEAKTLFVKASMGSGKTVALINKIKKLFADKPAAKVLVLSFRCSFGRELNQKLAKADLDFNLYSDIKDHITDAHSRVVVQVESLHRLRWTSPPDLLIMDEIESIQHQFISNTQKKLSDCWSVYRWAMSRCDSFICMDADLNPDTVKYVMDTRQDKTDAVYVHNTYLKSSKRVVFTAKEGDLLAKMHDLLNHKKRLFIANTRSVEWNKSLKQTIEKRHRGIKVRCYNSSNSSRKQIKEELENPNESWIKYDVVICTPTIQAGLSFDEKHFDIGLGFFCNIGPIQAKLQMMGRVRTFLDDTFYYSLMQINSCINKVDEPYRYVQYMESRRAYLDPTINIPDIIPTQLIPENQKRYFLCKELPYFKFYVEKQCALNRENNDFAVNFINAIRLTGCYKCEYLDVCKKDASTARADMKESKAEVMQENAEAISAAPMLPAYRVEELGSMIQANISLSSTEVAALRKYKTLKAYGLNQDELKDPTNFFLKYTPRRAKTAFSILSRMADPDAARNAQGGRNRKNEEEGEDLEEIRAKYDFTDIFWCREIVDIVKFGEIDATTLTRRYRRAEDMIKRNIIPICSVANRKSRPKIDYWPEESYTQNMNRLFNQVLDKIGFQIKYDKKNGSYDLKKNDLFCYGNEESNGRPRVWTGVQIGGVKHRKLSKAAAKEEAKAVALYRSAKDIHPVAHYTEPRKAKAIRVSSSISQTIFCPRNPKPSAEEVEAIESDED